MKVWLACVLTWVVRSCAPDCLRCDDLPNALCMECVPDTALSEGRCVRIVRQLDCNTGQFTDMDDYCQSCDSSCATCTERTANDCVTCTNPSEFVPNPPNICQACSLECATCSGSATSCQSCKLHAILNSGQCSCDLHFFPNPHAGACTPCNPDCNTCNGAAATNCLSCGSNATLTGGNACACNGSYYPNTTAMSCAPCDALCAVCGTSGTCVTCVMHASYAATTCSCDPGFTPSANACVQCTSTCLTCSAVGSTNCSTCYPNSDPITPPSSCVCSGGYVWKLVPTIGCAACHPTCQTCSDTTDMDCQTCKLNATLNSGQCSCDFHFFPNPHAGACTPCNSDCNTCNGAAATNCLSCGSNATLTGGNACTCNGSYYPNTTAMSCAPCDALCAVCVTSGTCVTCVMDASAATATTCSCDTGFTPSANACVSCAPTCPTCSSGYVWKLVPTKGCAACHLACQTCSETTDRDCQTCKAGAILSGVAPNSCLCDSTHYPSPDASNCLLCDTTCASCTGPGPTLCALCKQNSSLSGPAPSSCQCDRASFPSPDASNCLACHKTCATCTNSLPLCMSCLPGAFLQGPAPNTCFCSPGFFPNPDASQCSQCLPECLLCADGVSCSACFPNAMLTNDFLCKCILRTFASPDPSNCVRCPDDCITCFELGCRQCADGYYLLGSACFSHCPENYQEAPDDTCTPIDMTPPVPTLSVLSNNTLSISFDKPMNFSLSAREITVEVQTSNGDFSPVQWSEPLFSSSDAFTVSLVFTDSYLPARSSANFTFLYPDLVLSASLIPIAASSLRAELQPFGSPPTPTVRNSATAKATAATVTGVVAATTISSVLLSGPTNFLSLLNQLQLITYLAMTNIDLKSDFAGTLSALNVGNMIPNPLSNNMPSDAQDEESVPKYVKNYGIDSALFLSNAGSFLGVSAAILASYIPTYFFTNSHNPTLARYCTNRMKSLTFATPIALWTTSYLDLSLFSLLQVTQMHNTQLNVYGWISLIAAWVVVVLTWATPIALAAFTIVKRREMESREDESFNERWGTLYMDFSPKHRTAVIAFYSLFIIRRLLLAVTIILLPEFLSLFAVLNCGLSIASVIYVMWVKPYEGQLEQIHAASSEIGTAAAYLLVSAFVLPLSDSFQTIADQVGMWCVRGAIGVDTLLSAIGSVKALITVIKAYRDRMKEVRAKYEMYEAQTTQNPNARELFSPSNQHWLN